MASKMVTDRQAVGTDVLAALEAHGGEVADELRREVGDAAGGVAEFQATLRRRLEGRLEALVAADDEHLIATGDLAVARRRRDAAARELYRLLVAVRKLAEGLYGAGARELLRIEGRVAQRPVPMLRQARRVMARLADPEMPRPERQFAGATADETEWAEMLEPAIEALAAALDSTNMARRRAESTLLAKTEALAAYDLAHGRLARYGEALFELAGLPEYAARLRPRARRRGSAAARRSPSERRRPVPHPSDQPAGEEHVDLARREVVAEADLPVLALVTGDDLATRRLPLSPPPNDSPRLIRGGGRGHRPSSHRAGAAGQRVPPGRLQPEAYRLPFHHLESESPPSASADSSIDARPVTAYNTTTASRKEVRSPATSNGTTPTRTRRSAGSSAELRPIPKRGASGATTRGVAIS